MILKSSHRSHETHKMHAAVSALSAVLVAVSALDNGLARTPPMGWNSWNIYGAGVTAKDLQDTADFFVSSGLAAAGYEFVSSDDGWMSGRDASGRMVAAPDKFPEGMSGLAAYMKSKGLKLGLYSAASSVVCSGRVGSLYHEAIDAQTFADWNISLVKFDNCGEYGLGNARFVNFADAINATGVPIVLLTEPFSLQPTPSHREFAHAWRTTNDINPSYSTILDRADTNDKWGALAGPGGWSDPDMLECGNGGLTEAECRTHFGLWSLMKSPLILGTNLSRLTPPELAIISNRAVIAVNQDSAGVQGRKLAVNGAPAARFAGVAPCDADPAAGAGYNGVSARSLAWTPQASALNASYVMLRNDETGRCLAMAPYWNFAAAPLLLPCNGSDAAQAWLLPTGAARLGALLSAAALAAGAPAALTVGDSTLYAAPHGPDAPLPDGNYGLMNITLTAYAPEPPCSNRNCDDYAPGQMWYWSPRTRKLYLGHYSSNDYRCFGPNCYQLTGHLPAYASLCLAHVLSFDGNVGTDPSGSSSAGQDVWGGPLAGGSFVMALVNRDGGAARNITAAWSWLEAAGVGDATTFCATELFSGAALGPNTGGIALTVPPHDIAMLRLEPGSC